MIAKMRFVRLTGPVSELDRAIEKYVSGHEIQLENAVAELKDITGIRSHLTRLQGILNMLTKNLIVRPVFQMFLRKMLLQVLKSLRLI